MKSVSSMRSRANSIPIDGPCPGLAKELRSLLGYEESSRRDFMSLRQAAEMTGISHTTIASMVRGHKVGLEPLRKIAASLGADVETLVRLNDAQSYNPSSESINLRLTSLVALSGNLNPNSIPAPSTELLSRMERYVEPWTISFSVQDTTLEPDYHMGDVILVRQLQRIRNSHKALAYHKDRFVIGFYIYYDGRPWETSKDGMSIHRIDEDFKYIGVIVGCLRPGTE